jgi:hypothetical protein
MVFDGATFFYLHSTKHKTVRTSQIPIMTRRDRLLKESRRYECALELRSIEEK